MRYNYFNFEKFKDKYLLTNEQSFFCFLDEKNFNHLINEQFELMDDSIINELKSKYFVFDENEEVFIQEAIHPYRDNKNYVFYGTCLHIFVMTNACNMNCVYCQAQDSENIHKGMMDEDTAKKAVDIALQSPSQHLTFEFQGGEPLLNFPVIKCIVEYSEENCGDKKIQYSIVTNTLLFTDDMIDFIKQHSINISTSLDGNIDVHDKNRPLRTGEGTYEQVVFNIKKLQQAGIIVGAIQTTTRQSLAYVKEIVCTYQSLGLDYIFLRPLTPLGYAKEHWNEIGYTAVEFVKFYKVALSYIIGLNTAEKPFVEGHASIFLRKIIGHCADNYMELRSPCGAAIGQIAYYYDGRIYTCDEGRMLSEMGLPDFCMGDVWTSGYQALMESKVCKITCQASVMESLPNCCDCVFHSYCGVCPVVNYAMEQNIYSREANNYKCQIYKGILETIFEELYENPESTGIFEKWL